MVERETIRYEILSQIAKRGAGKTICPSEVARAIDPQNWREFMPRIRTIAEDLQEQGKLLVTQKGKTVCATTARGPIRLGLPTNPTSSE